MKATRPGGAAATGRGLGRGWDRRYELSEDERLAVARRNHRLLLEQGATPAEIRILLKDTPIRTCPHCGRECGTTRKGRPRVTCGSRECMNEARGAAQRGRPRPPAVRDAISRGLLESPVRRAAWDAMRGQRFPDERRAAISRGVSEWYRRRNGTSASKDH